MSNLTFEQLPSAVSEIRAKVDTIEQLLKQIISNEGSSLLTEYVNLNEASEILNLSKQTIYGYTSRRTIPFYKRGSRLYFKRKELNDWIGANRVKTIEEIQKEADNYLANRKRKY